MYYRLDADLNLNAGYLQEEDNYDQTLMFGEKIDESELVLPWPFTITSNAGGQLQLGDYYPGVNVMSERLVEKLRSCGADNLQIFPADITNVSTMQKIENYLVVNIIGLVAAASLAESATRPLADVLFFESLTIDPAKGRNLLVFRLAESRSDIIVHEKIAKGIQEGKFIDVTLEPVAGTSG